MSLHLHSQYLEVNELIAVAGLPLCGKTDLAMRIALAERQKAASFIFVADPNGNIPRALHDGVQVNPLRHGKATIDDDEWSGPYDSIRRSLSEPELVRCVHTVRTRNATPLLKLATEVALASLSKPDEHGIQYGPQSIMVIDEGMLWEELMGQCGENAMEMMMQRRHLHTKSIVETQAPHRINPLLFEMASRLELFCIDSRRGRYRLDEAGVPDRIIDAVGELPHRHRISWVRGEYFYLVVDDKGNATKYPTKYSTANVTQALRIEVRRLFEENKQLRAQLAAANDNDAPAEQPAYTDAPAAASAS